LRNRKLAIFSAARAHDFMNTVIVTGTAGFIGKAPGNQIAADVFEWVSAHELELPSPHEECLQNQ
jgi:hypothetical protein